MNKLEKIIAGITRAGISSSSYFIYKSGQNLTQSYNKSYGELIQSLDNLHNNTTKLKSDLERLHRDIIYLKGFVDGASLSISQNEKSLE